MPQNHIIFEGRRRAARHHTCKANGPIPGAGLVNGPIAPDGCKAAAPSTSESTPAVTPTGTKPQLVLNGYINHRYKGKNAKLAPNEGRRTSAVTDASAAARASGGGIPGDVSVNGVTTVDADAYSHNSDQMTPEYRLSAAMKNKRSKKFRRKKRWVINIAAALNKSFGVKCTFIHNYSTLSVRSSLSDWNIRWCSLLHWWTWKCMWKNTSVDWICYTVVEEILPSCLLSICANKVSVHRLLV